MHAWNARSGHALWARHSVSHGSCGSRSLHQTRMHLLSLHLARVGILLHVVEVAKSRLGGRSIVLESTRHAALQLVEMVEIELLMGCCCIHVEHLLLEAQLRWIEGALPISASVAHLASRHSLPGILLRLRALGTLRMRLSLMIWRRSLPAWVLLVAWLVRGSLCSLLSIASTFSRVLRIRLAVLLPG